MEKKTLQSYLEEKLNGQGVTKEGYSEQTFKEDFEIRSVANAIRLSDVAKYVVEFYTGQGYNQVDPKEMDEGQLSATYSFRNAKGSIVSILVTVHAQGGMILGTVQSLDDFDNL